MTYCIRENIIKIDTDELIQSYIVVDRLCTMEKAKRYAKMLQDDDNNSYFEAKDGYRCEYIIEEETEETKPEEYAGYEDSSCFGCQKFDSGYNCKHCQYGDDGRYSVYDVYTPSELGLNVY